MANLNLEQDIINYVIGSLFMPIEDRKQLEAMVILHYDIPDNEAHRIVGKALVKAIEVFRRDLIGQRAKQRKIEFMISKLENWTPELTIEGINE